MKRNLEFNNLIYLLDSLVGKQRKKTWNKQTLGRPFNRNDVFHPGFIALINLIKFKWPNFFELEWEETSNLYSQEELSKNLNDRNYKMQKWYTGSLQIWVPFLEFNVNDSIRQSFDNWYDTSNMKLVPEDVEKFRKQGFSDESILKIEKHAIDKHELFLNLIGETYANSLSHGVNLRGDTNKSAPIMSVVDQKIINNSQELWTMMHVDMGMTILGNLRAKAPNKIENMSDYDILRWVVKQGSSSKSDVNKVKGGGITVLKEVLLFGGKLEIISGEYIISITIPDLENIDEDENLNIEKITHVSVKKIDYNFPGTLVWCEIPINTNNSKKELMQMKKIRIKLEKIREKKLKGFVDE